MKILGYLAYSLGFIILFIVIGQVNSYFNNIIKQTFVMYPWGIFSILMYFPIGVYLGLPKFLKEYSKPGKWKINYLKMIFVGLPMLYISFYWFYPFSYPIPAILVHSVSLFKFGTLILGFVIIDSITKK